MINEIKTKYYHYQPNEFLPVYEDGELANKAEFHKYRVKAILNNPRAALYQFTHYSS